MTDSAAQFTLKLLEIMARLRDPDGGCPWDVKQDFATIAPYTIEEAYEVADAIERKDMSGLRDELGDLLLQVVFHAQMAQEQNAFDFAAVAQSICDKMIRRHPHVFADVEVADADEQTVRWEELKAHERTEAGKGEHDAGALAGVPAALPALLRADKLGKRAARVGFDWPDTAQVIRKVEEELTEVQAELDRPDNVTRIEQELGDLLFACAQLARHVGVNPETALRRANRRFERRFRDMEAHVAAKGQKMAELGLDRLEAEWQAVKERERHG
ncbi:MAG: nucleoside triphosphate pyrophosphohydrolase [Alphaproteobacteria bacterium]